MSNPASKGSTVQKAVIILGLLIVALFVLVRIIQPKKDDLDSAVAANIRGIGFMDQFQYASAAEEFKIASKAAPNWLPAKVNLGIALYNLGGGSTDDAGKESNLQAAIRIFEEVIAVDAKNIHAHYNLGIVQLYLNELNIAAEHFKIVSELAPKDGHTWLLRGRCIADASDSPEAYQFFQKALELNPYLNAARYALAQHRDTNDEIRTKLLNEFNEFMLSNSDIEYVEKYTDMGRYSFVIGKMPIPAPNIGVIPVFESPKILVNLPSQEKLNPTPEDLELTNSFGSLLVRADFNRDKQIDVIVASPTVGLHLLLATAEGMQERTIAWGLPNQVIPHGIAIGDYNNDGLPDLAFSNSNGIRLFKNIDGTRFEEVTQKAGFDLLQGSYTGIAWADLDLDGDLDLLVCKGNEKPAGSASLEIMLNVGEAPAVIRGNAPPLTTAFKKYSDDKKILPTEKIQSFILTDIDGDFDLDIVCLGSSIEPIVIINDRLLRFHREAREWLSDVEGFHAGLVFDANDDEQSDILLISNMKPPLLLLSNQDEASNTLVGRFTKMPSDSPILKQAQVVDLDADGRSDIVGITTDLTVTALQSEGSGKFIKKVDPFGLNGKKVQSLTLEDLNADCQIDILLFDESNQLHTSISKGNGNSSLVIQLSGIRERREPGAGRVLRANADGIGTRLQAQMGNVSASLEYTTLSAGLGQSLAPIRLGIGKSQQMDVLRLRWPDSMYQAELNQRACENILITENNRKPTSCPVLFVWNGNKFEYITDFLGGGALGEIGPTGAIRPARPSESVVLPNKNWHFQNQYKLKITEPMDEVLFLDQVKLLEIDHPHDYRILVDERFDVTGQLPSEKVLAFQQTKILSPPQAKNHLGEDVLSLIRQNDQQTVSHFAKRSWLGYAENHFVEFEMPSSLQTNTQNLYLILSGWTDYPFPESIYAATQAGIPTIAPILEQQLKDGSWIKIADVGFPAGLPKTMVKEITGAIRPDSNRFRLSTNLQIHWDEVAMGIATPDLTLAGIRIQTLSAAEVTLQHRGFVQEYYPNGKSPIAYEDDKLEPVATTKWKGKLTKTGNVTPLLQDFDDRYAIIGPGDELICRFDSNKKPDQARTLILQSKGYTKDTAPTTITGGQVPPYPFKAMLMYPYNIESTIPEALQKDIREWHTRPAGAR